MSIMRPSITGITADSRLVQAGFMFVAIVGHKMDGRQFIDDAMANGATVVVVPRGTVKQCLEHITWIEVDNPRLFLAEEAAKFYHAKPQHLTVVTGTNGKTSTVNFCRQLWSGLGIKGASLGTLGVLADGISDYNGMTTPDAVALHKALKLLSDHEVTHLALEASSQGMDQDRLHGLKFKAAAFTNLTQDHLDYHHTMDEYLAAKLKLVRELLADDGVAILNADDVAHIEFLNICKARGIAAWTYGLSGKELQLIKREPVADGQILDIRIFEKLYRIHLPLVGLFQAMNVLCALGIVCADKNVNISKVVSLLETLEGITGRLQKVKHSHANIGAYIDYAHTPDGLENVLSSLRPHTTGKLMCVFGCGGDRDKRKRPMMGEIASRLADVTIITDDNPRSENPKHIHADILAGAPNAPSTIIIEGRKAAIQYAVNMLQVGDVLVVAGKGHEQGQIFATHTDPFDDYTETESALQNKHIST